MFNFDPQHLFHLDCLIQFSALNQSTIPCTCVDMTVVLEGIFTNISSTPCDKTHSCLILTYATNAWLLDDNNISMILFNRCYYLLLKPIQDNKLRHVLSWNIRYFLNACPSIFSKIFGEITFSYLRHFRMLNFRHFP